MSGGRVWLDQDRRASRYIEVSRGRHHAIVTLDRDDYVYTARSEGRGDDVEMSPAFSEALASYHDAAFDHLYVHGYTGSFGVQVGPSIVTVPVPFQLADAAVEALRAAEMDDDVSRLDALTQQLTVPLDSWLAPGERRLLQGIDFTASPTAFLEFLRAKARARGLRLNGRAAPGAVWVRPMMTTYMRDVVSAQPDTYRGYADPDRYATYQESDDAPIRPETTWTRHSEPATTPVAFLDTDLDTDKRDCPCGTRRERDGRWSAEHVKAHMLWSLGVPVPGNLPRLDGHIVVVTATSPRSWRKLAARCARVPRLESHYDFSSFSVGDGMPEEGNPRAYLYVTGGVVTGFVSVYDTANAHHYALKPWGPVTAATGEGLERPVVNVIFTAHLHRRSGVGKALVGAIAEDAGIAVTEVAWSTPFSDAGRALAGSINADGHAWVT